MGVVILPFRSAADVLRVCSAALVKQPLNEVEVQVRVRSVQACMAVHSTVVITAHFDGMATSAKAPFSREAGARLKNNATTRKLAGRSTAPSGPGRKSLTYESGLDLRTRRAGGESVMRLASARIALLLALLAGCSPRSQEPERDQAARLRASYSKHLAEHHASIGTENRLIGETLGWLNGTAINAPRSQAVREARQLMDRWAKVYFVPRYMHEQLRYDKYSGFRVKAVQQQLLDHMKQRYFELHDYQRYAQHASEWGLNNTPAGRLPPGLVEFRQRLEVRAPAVDGIGPLLATLAE